MSRTHSCPPPVRDPILRLQAQLRKADQLLVLARRPSLHPTTSKTRRPMSLMELSRRPRCHRIAVWREYSSFPVTWDRLITILT